MKLADNKATLSFSNGSPSIDMPVYSGNIGPLSLIHISEPTRPY